MDSPADLVTQIGEAQLSSTRPTILLRNDDVYPGVGDGVTSGNTEQQTAPVSIDHDY